jgi:hypothetical protein
VSGPFSDLSASDISLKARFLRAGVAVPQSPALDGKIPERSTIARNNKGLIFWS